MMQDVPVIGIRSLRQEPDSDDAVGAVNAIADACRTHGFFQVIGHQVPAPLIRRVWDVTGEFFDLPRERKSAVSRSKDNPRGYYDRELTKNRRDLLVDLRLPCLFIPISEM